MQAYFIFNCIFQQLTLRQIFKLIQNGTTNRQEQLQASRINARLLNEREKEINNIVKSIHDLNELFNDIATMVVDQVGKTFVALHLKAKSLTKSKFI